MTYTRSEFLLLTSGDAQMSAYGDIEWVYVNGTWRGTVAVATVPMEATAVRLLMKVGTHKPSEPTVVLIVRNIHMKRVDVNGMHRGVRSTHVQWASTPDAEEQFAETPDWFVDVPLSDTVQGNTYHRVFEDAAKVLHVDVQGMTWIDPPEVG